MAVLRVCDLDTDRFDQAYPLARAAVPSLSHNTWRQYLESRGQPRPSGVLGVENARQVLLGLAVWFRCHGLEHNSCLVGDPVMVFDLVGGSQVATLLIEGLEERARAFGCEGLQVHVLGEPARLADTPLLRSLMAQGHRIEGARLCKALNQKTSSGSPSARDVSRGTQRS